MLQSFKSLTWNFDVSDVRLKCFLLTYTLDCNFLCQKYWNFVGNPVYFKVLCSLTYEKFSCRTTWNFHFTWRETFMLWALTGKFHVRQHLSFMLYNMKLLWQLRYLKVPCYLTQNFLQCIRWYFEIFCPLIVSLIWDSGVADYGFKCCTAFK
jgi:hypothetical protein